MSKTLLSKRMREMLWAMLAHQRKSRGILILEDERTVQALVRRGLLKAEPSGYVLNTEAARRALKECA